jgi:hypothetical protein
MVVCKEEEEYVLRVTDSHATLFALGAPGSELAGDGRKGLSVKEAAGAKEKGKKGVKEAEAEAVGKGKAMAAR